jgi:hypothetical protein
MEKLKESDIEKIKQMKKWTALVGWELIIVEAVLEVLERWSPINYISRNTHGGTWSTVLVLLLGVMALYVSFMCARYLTRLRRKT